MGEKRDVIEERNNRHSGESFADAIQNGEGSGGEQSRAD
jgi:hypothetical protein